MTKRNFTTTIELDQTPEAVFDAINDVRSWWTGDIQGRTDVLGAEFTYRYEDLHETKQKITELVPGKKIVWRVLDSRLEFVKEKNEWDGSEIVFEIAKKGDKTELRFTHVGLVPEIECYDKCSSAWGYFVQESLRNFLATGTAQRKPERKSDGKLGARDSEK